jgi:signal transduction histidine kinase
MDLASVEKRLSEMKDHELRCVLLDKVRSMSDLSDRTIHSVQRISAELRPPVLDHFGLLAAIEWHADEFQRRTDIKCTVSATDEKIEFDEATSTALFRILQEALTNVARHAQAGNVTVSLKKDADNLVLAVKDDGKGVTEEDMSNSSSLGLLGMRERTLALGGELRICGVPGKGTTVEALIPNDSLDEG